MGERHGGAMQNKRNALAIEADEQIKGGASGGPIISKSGELVGIVSHFMEAHGKDRSEGMTPRSHLLLPVWVCRKIVSKKAGLSTHTPRSR
jgi:hypothetical protein